MAAIYQSATEGSRRFERILIDSVEHGRKSERTQVRLQAAACRLLERIGPDGLKVADICSEARSAHGTFYVYFRDIPHLLAETLSAFVSFLRESMRRAARDNRIDPVRSTTAAYVSVFEQNSGLMRCLVSRLEGFPEASAEFEKLNREWAATVADARLRRLARDRLIEPQDEAVLRGEFLRRAYALGGMVDQYLIMLHFGQDAVLADASRDRDAVVSTLHLIWKRGMQP